MSYLLKSLDPPGRSAQLFSMTTATETQKTAQDYSQYVNTMADRARTAFREIRSTTSEQRNQALLELARNLEQPATQSDLIKENEKDLKAAKENQISDALYDRLVLNEKRIQSMIQALHEIAAFPDPVGEVIDGQSIQGGIQMVTKRVPIGVVFTVYESRPNVTVDVGALCVKSGNAAILRGGKEAFHSNVALYKLFQQALESAGLAKDAVQLIEETDRQCMLALLDLDNKLDLVVPRGGEGLIRFVSQNTRIAVVKHDKGVCNLYIEKSADPKIAVEVAINAKLQRPSVCNAIENLLIHSGYAHTGELLGELKKAGALLRGCSRTREIDSSVEEIADEFEEYNTEYLDNRLAVKIVDSTQEATDFIATFGSGHSEAIVSENRKEIELFESLVDTAGIFINCSTRFHDGGQMGMGAEVGISTGRLHVRGPMGVRDLTTTTRVLRGDGQVRS